MATNLYYDQSLVAQLDGSERTIYSSTNAPNPYSYPSSQPIASDYANWFDDSVVPWKHYQSIGGAWVFRGCVDPATGNYLVGATPPYLTEHLASVVPTGPEPRQWVDDRVCPAVLMLWDPCANSGAGGYVAVGSGVATNGLAFSSPDSISVQENVTLTGITLAGVQSDGTTPLTPAMFGITGGEDAALFTIDGLGRLIFITAPDYEAPTDASAPSNVYEVGVTANDGVNSVVQAISVTVTDDTADNGTQPVVSSMALVGGPDFDTGDQLCVDVTFDQAVNVAGVPEISGGTWEVPSSGELTPVSASAPLNASPASSAVDGDLASFWIPTWSGAHAGHQITFDAGSVVSVSAVKLVTTAHTVSGSADNFPEDFQLDTSLDGVTFTSGALITGTSSSSYTSVNPSPPGAITNRYNIPTPVLSGRYFRFNSVSSLAPSDGNAAPLIFDWKFTASLGAATSSAPDLTYVSGAGTNTLRFCYTVQSGDTAEQLDLTGLSITLPTGAAITGTTGGIAANAALPNLSETVDVN